MESASGESGGLEKKSRPSLDGCVSADRREEIWWSTGVVDSGFGGEDFVSWLVGGVDVWMA